MSIYIYIHLLRIQKNLLKACIKDTQNIDMIQSCDLLLEYLLDKDVCTL